MLFLVFISFFLLFIVIIVVQNYRDLILPKYFSPEKTTEKLGEKISLRTPLQNRKVSGFYLESAERDLHTQRRLLILIHDHWHEPNQLFGFVQYFTNLGFDTFVYETANHHNQATFGFGNLDSEGVDCQTIISWYAQQDASQPFSISGFAIGFSGSTFIQLANAGQEFDFLILEQLPTTMISTIERKLLAVLPQFWLRFLIQKCLILIFKLRHKFNVSKTTNLLPCSVPMLLLYGKEHPFISSADTYRFLPYYTNMRTFYFSTNYINSAIFSDPQRYFFLIDTFLTEIQLEN